MEFKLLTRDECITYLPQISDLYRLIFNNHLSEEYFRWRYLENPVKGLYLQIALENGKVVASAGMSPCLLYLNGRITQSILSLNSMVHPDYQRTGVFMKLHQSIYRSLVDNGYNCLISFPNHLSHRLSITKLGRKDVYEIPMMVLELETIDKGSRVVCETDHQFIMDYSAVSPFPHLNRLIKDRSYLQWRYYREPINQYYNFVLHNKNKVSSYMVVKRYLERLNIIDFQPRDPLEGEYLLDVAINYAHSLNLKTVSTWAPRHTYYHNIAEKKGFRNNMPITYFILKEINCEIPGLTHYSNWYIQLGDFNAY